jgi:hypothetical protein
MTGLHPYAEGNIAAAQREIAKCVEEIRKALRAPGNEGWRHIGVALAHASTVKAQLADAVTLDEMAVVGTDEEEGE